MFIIKDSMPVLALGSTIASAFNFLSWAVMLVALFLTVYSMMDYFYHARDVIELAEPEPDASAEVPSAPAEPGS